MITRTTTIKGQDTSGIKTGGFDIQAITASLQSMTQDGEVRGVIIDTMSGRGLARVETIVDTRRHQFTIAGGMINYRGLSHRFTV